IFCLALAAGIALVAAAAWAGSNRAWETQTWIGLSAWLGSLTVAGLLCAALRHAAIKSSHPNRDYPLMPAPYPGAPRGRKLEEMGSPIEPLKRIEPATPAATSPAGALQYQRQRP